MHLFVWNVDRQDGAPARRLRRKSYSYEKMVDMPMGTGEQDPCKRVAMKPRTRACIQIYIYIYIFEYTMSYVVSIN